MRIAILSDIHANLEALQEVEASLARLGADRVVCLGDVVGYGASPNACCTRVRHLCSIAILGNHDAAVSGRMDYGYYYEAARHALDWTAQQLERDHLAWLGSLPYTHRLDDLEFSHGSPLHSSEYQYVFAVEQVQELMPHFAQLSPVTFIGHSHLCKAFALDAGGTVEELEAVRLELRRDRKYILSVGSVGQPRDYDSRASFLLYDADSGVAAYHRVAYDVAGAAQKIFDANLASGFGKRLFFGV
ncbi:MAG TPA: metallophosphoesterase family protein [Anaeromyxobacteraceae bacterium]|nr:metallophosphoesterase family protein [Anaeromyxobacteraceae bacterium]